MDFDAIAEAQGWDSDSLIDLLRAFITEHGLNEELDDFAQTQADYENEV